MDRTPVLSRDRAVEAFMIDDAQAEAFRLSDDARRLLLLVDGMRTEREVVNLFVSGDDTRAAAFLPACKAFLDQCVDVGLVCWKAEAGEERALVVVRPRRRL